MATDTKRRGVSIANVETNEWNVGAGGGFVGSILFGFVMRYVMEPPLLEMAIPAMYGIEGPALAAGWALHLFHGVVLGLAYVAIVQAPGLYEYARTDGGAIVLGIAYGVLTTVVLAVLVMPLWLQAVRFGGAPPFPNVSVPGTIVGTVGHVIYALPLAIGYALVAGE